MKKRVSITSCEVKADLAPLRASLSEVATLAKEEGLTDEIKSSIINLYDEQAKDKNISLSNFLKELNNAGLPLDEWDFSFLKNHVRPVKIPQLQISEYSLHNVDLFRSAHAADLYAQQYFINQAFKYTFLNRARNYFGVRYITDGSLFNSGIINFKNALCQEIILYKKFDGFPTDLFNALGAVINPGTNQSYYEELMTRAKDEFIPNFIITANPEKDTKAFNAFSALYILNNFDDILSTTLEGIVKVNMDNKGDINNTDYAKEIDRNSTVYWTDDSHLAKGISKFTSHLAKFIISTMPKMTINASGQVVLDGNEYCTTADMFMLAGILKQAEYEYNLIHCKEDGFKPLIINLNPKQAIKQLILESDRIPIMKKYGRDLALSFETFLYTGDTDNKSVEELYNDAVKLNPKVLDIESLLVFEINKNVTPTYIEYNLFGLPELKNYGKRYKASNRLDDNIINTLFLNAQQEKGKTAIDQINVKLLAQLSLNRILTDTGFLSVCLDILEIKDPSAPKYKEFFENYLPILLDIILSIQKFRPASLVITNQEYLYKEAESEFKKLSGHTVTVKNSQVRLRAVWLDFKLAANRFMSTEPITTFDNLEGASIPVYRLSSIFFLDNEVIWGYHKNDPNRTKLNFFVSNPAVLSRYTFQPTSLIGQQNGELTEELVNTYYETSGGFALLAGNTTSNTGIDEMIPEDLLIISFLGNWVGLRLSNGVIGIQPAPYSDKRSIGIKFVNEHTQVLNPTSLNKAATQTLGSILSSNKAAETVLGLDYYYRKNQKINLAQKLLLDWLALAKSLRLKLTFKPLTDEELIAAYNNPNFISQQLLQEIANLDLFIKNLIASRKNNLEELQYKIAMAATKLQINFVDELHMAKGRLGMGLNESFLYDITNLSTKDQFIKYQSELFDEFYNAKETKALKDFILKSRNPNFDNWKTANKRGIKETVFKPALQAYFVTSGFLNNLYRDLAVKEEYLDKAKFKYVPDATLSDQELQLSYRKLDKSARTLGMSKRMGLYPATVENYLQNKIDGVSPTIKVAVVDDAKEETFNLKGSTHNQDIFDGCAFISPFYSILENNSLPGRGIKGTKKPLGVHVDDIFSSLFKYAEFPITNDRIKNSRTNRFDLLRTFKKMHNLKFQIDGKVEDIDLTKDIYGRSLENVREVLGKDLYYTSGFANYKIVKLVKRGINEYELYTLPVYNNGEPVDNIPVEERKPKIVRLNSLYNIWEALGGYESKELVDGKLQDSEINIEFISNLIWRVGKTQATGLETVDQTNTYQPLRKYFIAMIANKGAIKRGSANTISAQRCWDSDDDLAYFGVKTSDFGIQLDANHASDLSELTEMSQTISALAALGYTKNVADLAYTAIAKIINASLSKASKYLTNIEQGNIKKVLNQISQLIVRDLALEKNITTAASFVKVLSDRMKSGLILPISDKRFYKIFAKLILSDLNKSSIKRKYTGLGGILNPSSNILQLFNVGDKSYTYSELINLARAKFNNKSWAKNKAALVSYWKSLAEKGQINKHQDLDIVTLYLMSLSNPDVFNNIEEALSLANLVHTIKDGNDILINPNYGFTKVDMSDINILDAVAYPITQEDGTTVFKVKYLTTLEDYLDFKYNHAQSDVYLCQIIPHDLRPQIEHWVSDNTKKDTWSLPSVYLSLKANLYDPKKKSEFLKSEAFYMLKSLLEYLGNIDSLNYSPILKGFLNGERLAKKRILKLLDNIRIRLAELHTVSLDFKALKREVSDNNISYNWNEYLGGTETTKGINLLVPTDELLSSTQYDFMPLSDYGVDPAEVILPKLYKSNFNFGNRSLNEITPEYFYKAETYYRSSLKDKRGKSLKPIDFLVRTHTGNFNIVIGDVDTELYGTNVKLSEGDWLLDSNGNKLFRIDPNNMALFVDDNGMQTLVIQQNNVTENSIDLVLNSVDNLVSILPFLDNISELSSELIDASLNTVIANNVIKTHNYFISLAIGLSGQELVDRLNDIYLTKERNYKLDLANTLYNSFLKTLDIISTRIPTQALLSFMAMRVKALTNDESNNVFVSRWLLWLLGSDLDIDKSYMMGVNVSKNGIYNHWSPLADFTTSELAKISETLPIPNKKQVTLPKNHWKLSGDNIIDITITDTPSELTNLIEDFNLLLTIEDSLVLQDKYNIHPTTKTKATLSLAIKARILQILDQSDEFSILEHQSEYKSLNTLLKSLNRHNTHEVTPEEARNIVANSMKKVSLDGRNMLSAYSPIDDVMLLFKDELELHEFETALRNLDDVLSTFRILYENAVGKKDVGIMANGLKVFFCATQYFNDYWKSANSTQKAGFLRKINLGLNGEEKINYHISISDTLILQTAILALNLQLSRIIGQAEYAKVKSIVTPNDDASLLISSLVSLATDNAKELALAKLNAGINLACIHVYLTIMGYSAKDIVDYTTSLLFKDFTSLVASSLFDKNKKGRIDKQVWTSLAGLAKTSKFYTVEDVNNLHRLYNCALEATSIARTLGINLGIKVSEFEASTYIDNFQDILPKQILVATTGLKPDQIFKNGKISTVIIPHLLLHVGLPNTPALLQEYFTRILRANLLCDLLNIKASDLIDMHKYFTNKSYRDAIVAIYDVFKETFNVYDIINYSKHFYSMLQAFDTYINVLIQGSARAKFALLNAKKLFDSSIITNNEIVETDYEFGNSKTEVYKVPYKFDESSSKQASRLFDDYILSEFLLGTSNYDFKVKTHQEGASGIFDIKYGKGLIRPNVNIEAFIKFVNVVLIPRLQSRVINSTDQSFYNNMFLKSLRPDITLSDKRKKEPTKTAFKWVFNFDVDKLNSPACRSLYFDIVTDFDKIADKTLKDIFGEQVLEGAEVKLGDLLYLYDQILNLSTFGQSSLEKVFDHYIENYPDLPLAIAQVETEHDEGLRQLEFTKELFMAFLVRNSSKLSAARGIVEFGKNRQIDTNVFLFSMAQIQSLANDYYKSADTIIDAIRKNILIIKPIC